MPFNNLMFYSGSICHEAFSKSLTGADVRRMYSYLAYLRCISTYLPNYLSANECNYLLYTGKPVLNQAQTTFYLYRPSGSNFAGAANEIRNALGPGKKIGTFARSASVASWLEAYGIPKEVSYLQDNETGTYEVVEAVKNKDVVIEGKKVIQFKNNMGTQVCKVGNASSRILVADVDQFIGQMLKAKLGYPVFSVCDCNSFHTSGYIFGAFAVRSVMTDEDNQPVAFINFDQHGDTGGRDIVGSDTWGDALLSKVKNGCYLSIGNAGKLAEDKSGAYTWLNAIRIRKDSATITPPVGKTRINSEVINRKSWAELDTLQKLQYYAGVIQNLKSKWTAADISDIDNQRITSLSVQASDFPIPVGCDLNPTALVFEDIFERFFKALVAHVGPISYAFVTVDRDALKDHQTQWGDQCFYPNGTSLINAIKSVYGSLLAASPDCELIGLDITGLPESRNAYIQQTGNILAPTVAWSKAEDQIVRLRAWGENTLELQEETKKKKNLEITRLRNLRRNQELRDQETSNLNALSVYRMTIIFDNLVHDLRGAGLKRCLSGQARSTISNFWHGLKPSLSSLSANPLLTKETRSSLSTIANLLYQAGRQKGLVNKELKSLLGAYGNRITSLLQS